MSYRNPDLPTAERVADLLAQMTFEEKLAQLGSAWIFQLADGNGFTEDRAAPLLANGIGQITRISGASSLDAQQAARAANDIQRFLRDHTRLGIPAMVHEEICSGLMARDAVAFPQAIGVASTFRPHHNRSISDLIRQHMRTIGAHQGLSPVLDVCRDPRWGRTEETYGEDPYVVARFGIEFVAGLQGDDLADGVVATAKHFVGYGASEGGMNWAPAHIPERELRDVYLRPFDDVIRDAGLKSVMNAYHELDGVPCTRDRWLLTEVLRDEWGFDGIVVSDYFAVAQLLDYHGAVPDRAAAAAASLHAGIDIELPNTDCYGSPLATAIERGDIETSDIDLAAGRSLALKFDLGLFEQPLVDESVDTSTLWDTGVIVAHEVARDSLVLVRNNGLLPLLDNPAIAVIGPSADSARNMLGDYSYAAHVESLADLLDSGDNVLALPVDSRTELTATTDMSDVITVLGGLRQQFSDVRYAVGCSVTGDDTSGFDEAVAVAAAADVAICVVGDKSGLTADCTTGESRDATSLRLPGVQEDLVRAVAATGTPVVLVIISGRPLGSPEIHGAAGAVLVGWLPGQAGGTAIAEAVAGVFSPGGKLPISYPRTSGQVPTYYAHKPSGGRSHWKGPYVDCSNLPLYPFGHGLTYSEFTISVVEGGDQPVTVGIDDSVDVSVEVANVGDRCADEVVQVYSRHRAASVTQPVLSLQTFSRVTIEAGSSTRLEFRVPVRALGFAGVEKTYVIEPGVVEFFVGSSSASTSLARTATISVDGPTPARRVMSDTPTRSATTSTTRSTP